MMTQVPLDLNNIDNLNAEIFEKENSAYREGGESRPLTGICIRSLKQIKVYNDLLKEHISFLEIGSGLGGVIKHLSSRGKGYYVGLEPSKTAFEKAKKLIGWDIGDNFILFNDSLELKIFSNRAFDYILAFHVIEHLNDPTVLLEKSHKWLKRNGKLIIGCPNFSGLLPRLNPLQWRARNKYHKWLIGIRELIPLMEDYGFIIDKYFTYGGYPAPRTFLQEIANKFFKLINMGDALFLMASKSNADEYFIN